MSVRRAVQRQRAQEMGEWGHTERGSGAFGIRECSAKPAVTLQPFEWGKPKSWRHQVLGWGCGTGALGSPEGTLPQPGPQHSGRHLMAREHTPLRGTRQRNSHQIHEGTRGGHALQHRLWAGAGASLPGGVERPKVRDAPGRTTQQSKQLHVHGAAWLAKAIGLGAKRANRARPTP